MLFSSALVKGITKYLMAGAFSAVKLLDALFVAPGSYSDSYTLDTVKSPGEVYSGSQGSKMCWD